MNQIAKSQKVSEILFEIQHNHLEIEILEALQDWIIKDRKKLQETVIEQRTTLNLINKITQTNLNPKKKLEQVEHLSKPEERKKKEVWV